MRTALQHLVLAVGLVAVPLTASALDVRTTSSAPAAVPHFEHEKLSFDYVEGQTVRLQNFDGEAGPVTMVTISFVDPVTGQRARDSYMTISVYDRAPIVQGATTSDDAIAKGILNAMSKALGNNIRIDPTSIDFPGHDVKQAFQITTNNGGENAVGILAVVPAQGGHAAIFVQQTEENEKINDAMLVVLESLTFGPKS